MDIPNLTSLGLHKSKFAQYLSLYYLSSNFLRERPEPLSLSIVFMTKFLQLGRRPVGWGRSRAWSKIHARGA